MKPLLLLAVLALLGCGGSDSNGPEHYDRPCSTVFPSGGQCSTCSGGDFACGSTCIPEAQSCSAAPGCACNSFRIQ